MHTAFDFRGATVLVTGAGRNIGRACALEFARAGANVAVNIRRNEAEGAAVAEAARAFGVKARTYVADVSRFEEVARMTAAIRDELGAVDAYVSNVGLRLHQSLEDASVEDWQRVLDTSLSPAFYLAQCLVPAMKTRRRGRIVHVSGRDGFVGKAGRPHGVAAKAGLHGFTKALAHEVAAYGVTVNTVVPGLVDTTRPPEHYPGWEPVQGAATVPVGRLAEPREIAWACLFLASDEAAYITGQALHLNGGLSMF
jgi:NAD(P)-dependent dehydrogenase (short-subunit alcohol dehydrogenase family)